MKPGEAIPHPARRPIVGNLFDLNLQTPIQSMMELRKTYGPIFSLEVPTESLVVVSSRELAHELCDESRFEKKVHGPLDLVRDFAGDGLITAYSHEENWRKAHMILAPAFGPGLLRQMFPLMHELTEQLVLKWERHGTEEAIDVSDDMTRLTVDAITLCAFGHRLNSFYDRALHPFVGAMVRGLTESSARTRRPPFVTPFLFGKKKQYEFDIGTMHRLADEIIERRKKEPNTGKQDLLDLMLHAADPETGERLSDENIRFQIVTFLIAGHETTSGLLSFALYELLRAPEALARVRAQVDEVLGNRAPTYDSLAQLTEVDAVLKETLRLWPTAPAFAVRSLEPETVIGGRYPIRREQTVLLLLPSLQRDPEVWEDPEEFRPSRMYRDAFRALPPDAWKPFGNGRRSCIGRGFAMQEATLALAMVLQRFDLEHVDPNFQLKIKESLTLKPANFLVRARRRALLAAGSGAGAGRAEKSAVLPRIQQSYPFTIRFGSRTGTAEGYAETLAAQGKARGLNIRVEPLDASPLEEIPLGTLVVITASYDGKPPENAQAAVKELAHGKSAAMAGLDYAVFGCGNRDWARTYQSIPKFFQRKLGELGARNLLPAGEADSSGSDAEQSFLAWTEQFWKAFEGFAARDAARVEILPALGEKNDSDLSPEATRLLRHYGLEPSVAVRAPSGEITDLGRLLKAKNLTQPATAIQLRALAAHNPCPPHAAELRQLARNPDNTRSALELLLAFRSCQIGVEAFLPLLNLEAPGHD